MPRDRRPDADPKPELSQLGLLDFMPAVSARVHPATHFARIADAFTHAVGGGLRICFAAPRQHGKTTLVKHAIPWMHLRHPRARIFYATYAQQYTEIQSRDIRRIAFEAGVRVTGDHNTLKGWTLEAGGDFTASSVDGPANGLGANVAIIDDPFKGPEDAYSRAHRDRVEQWFLQVVTPMLAPGASVFIIASRWDEDDLSGRLIAGQGYEEVCIPAIEVVDPHNLPGGKTRCPGCLLCARALCPNGPNPDEPRTLDFLLDIRDGRKGPDGKRRGGIGPHAFSALFQGKPLPRSGALFGEATLVDALPPDARIVALIIGGDLAYSAESGSDRAAFVAILEDSLSDLYIAEVVGMQQEIARVEAEAHRMRGAWSAHDPARVFGSLPRIASYMNGPEIGVARLLMLRGLPIEVLPARFNKFVRAQKTAVFWNQGRIKVLRGQAWTDDFLRKVRYFTGMNDQADDEVDAMVSGIDALVGAKCESLGPGHQFAFGTRVM